MAPRINPLASGLTLSPVEAVRSAARRSLGGFGTYVELVPDATEEVTPRLLDANSHPSAPRGGPLVGKHKDEVLTARKSRKGPAVQRWLPTENHHHGAK